MYHVIASINGAVKRYDIPKARGTKYCSSDVDRYAKDCFSHSRCDFVAVADSGGIVRYISHTGQIYF